MKAIHALKIFANAIRQDGWENLLTGFGTARDKTEHTAFAQSSRLTDQECADLYHHEDIARKVARAVPKNMLREGFKITTRNPADAARLEARCEALGVHEKFLDGLTWGRVFGGGALLLGADDGLSATAPLEEERIRSFTFLDIYDKRRVQPIAWYENGASPKFGQPRIYQLTNLRSGGIAQVHESRLVLFRGAHTADQERIGNQGWDFSVYQATYNAIRQFSQVYKAAELLMTDASQGILKIRGLYSLITGGDFKTLTTRAQFMDLSRSIARSIMLDAEAGEEFRKEQTSFSGIGDMLDRAANRLSAASEIPVTILMGQAPAGLNATGASDIRVWYDSVQSDRNTELRPRLLRVVRLIARAERIDPAGVDIEFPPLWQETPKEKADREKVEADTDAVRIQSEVLTPEEVAKARYGGPKPLPFRIDPATRTPNLEVPPTEVPGALPPAKSQGPTNG